MSHKLSKALLIFTLFICSNIIGQDLLYKYVELLDANFGFKPKVYPYENLNTPEMKLLDNFNQCRTFDKLSGLEKLNFETIKNVKISFLKTEKKIEDVYWRITLQEWVFEDKDCLDDFEKTLDSMEHNRIQFCVNKGGIKWWSDDNSLIIMTSSAYNMTFQYDLIRRILKKK